MLPAQGLSVIVPACLVIVDSKVITVGWMRTQNTINLHKTTKNKITIMLS